MMAAQEATAGRNASRTSPRTRLDLMCSRGSTVTCLWKKSLLHEERTHGGTPSGQTGKIRMRMAIKSFRRKMNSSVGSLLIALPPMKNGRTSAHSILPSVYRTAPAQTCAFKCPLIGWKRKWAPVDRDQLPDGLCGGSCPARTGRYYTRF